MSWGECECSPQPALMRHALSVAMAVRWWRCGGGGARSVALALCCAEGLVEADDGGHSTASHMEGGCALSEQEIRTLTGAKMARGSGVSGLVAMGRRDVLVAHRRFAVARTATACHMCDGQELL